jgi:hypothetical protein
MDKYLRTQKSTIKTSYEFDLLINATHLVLCSPINVICIDLVLLEKSGMVVVDRSVASRLSLITLSSITVISKFTEC